MENKTKIIIGISCFVLAVVLIYIIKIQQEIIIKQNHIETQIIQFKQLGEGIARLESKMVLNNETLEKRIKDFGINYDKIQKDLDQHNAKLDAVAVIIGKTGGSVVLNVQSDYQKSNEVIPPKEDCLSLHGYCDKTQGLSLMEKGLDTNIPFGEVEFDATSANPWNLTVFPRKYYSVLSLGKNNQGQVIAHSQFLIEDKDGNKHVVSIDEKSFYEQVYETYRFYWWNPRIVGEYSLGTNTNVDFVSMFGIKGYVSAYTANKSRPTFMFGGLGAGYDVSNKKINISISPVAYNLFHTTDLIQNLYISPTVSMSTKGDVGFLGTLSLLF